SKWLFAPELLTEPLSRKVKVPVERLFHTDPLLRVTVPASVAVLALSNRQALTDKNGPLITSVPLLRRRPVLAVPLLKVPPVRLNVQVLVRVLGPMMVPPPKLKLPTDEFSATFRVASAPSCIAPPPVVVPPALREKVVAPSRVKSAPEATWMVPALE